MLFDIQKFITLKQGSNARNNMLVSVLSSDTSLSEGIPETQRDIDRSTFLPLLKNCSQAELYLIFNRLEHMPTQRRRLVHS